MVPGMVLTISFLCTSCRKDLGTHISKWSSDLKINGTQENVTFSGPAFPGLPCGVFLFEASVSFKNHKIEAPDWPLKNSSHSEGGF